MHFLSRQFIIPSLILTLGASSVLAAGPHKPRRRAPASPPLENGPGMQRTRAMDEQVQLLEHQFIRLLPLNREHLRQRKVLREQYVANPSLLRTRLAQLDASYEHSYRQILTLHQAMLLEEAHAAVPNTTMGLFMLEQLQRLP